MTTIRVFVVDDHEMIRIGLRDALSMESDIEIAGEASGFRDGLEGILGSVPNVAILDVRLGERSGVELCREVLDAEPSVRCLMYTSATGDDPLHESILAGASGYLLKDSSRDQLVDAVRRLAVGQSLIDPAIAGRVMTRLRAEANDPTAQLTEQEANVLELIADGLTNKQIADRLVLAEQTVKNYVSRVLTKLDMRRTQAALFAAGLRRKEDPDRD